MTVHSFVVTGKVIRNLSIPVTEPAKTQTPKFYSLYQSGKRIRTACYDMPNAYRVWGDEVIGNPELKIRRVELSVLEAR